MSVPNPETIRRYWIGKKPKVKLAVMEWFALKGVKTQEELAQKHQVTTVSMRTHIKNLENLGLAIRYTPYYPCLICGTNLHCIFPKFRMEYLADHYGPARSAGYLCVDCRVKLGLEVTK